MDLHSSYAYNCNIHVLQLISDYQTWCTDRWDVLADLERYRTSGKVIRSLEELYNLTPKTV